MIITLINAHVGSIRHVIKSIRNGGPSDNNQVLRVGDELLEVNGELLLGVTHEEAIRLVQSAPKDVKIIVCRLRETENDQEEEVSDNPTTGMLIICTYSYSLLLYNPLITVLTYLLIH